MSTSRASAVSSWPRWCASSRMGTSAAPTPRRCCCAWAAAAALWPRSWPRPASGRSATLARCRRRSMRSSPRTPRPWPMSAPAPQKAIGFLTGQVMKKTRGQANAGVVQQLIRDSLEVGLGEMERARPGAHHRRHRGHRRGRSADAWSAGHHPPARRHAGQPGALRDVARQAHRASRPTVPPAPTRCVHRCVGERCSGASSPEPAWPRSSSGWSSASSRCGAARPPLAPGCSLAAPSRRAWRRSCRSCSRASTPDTPAQAMDRTCK